MWMINVFCSLSLTSVLFLMTSAFQPIIKEGVVIRGSTDPIKDFDPINFSDKKDLAYLREAELKHGRWAMLGASSIPLIESFTHTPAIHEFQELTDYNKILIVTLIAAAEFQTMLIGWKLPRKDQFTLRDDYQPGDIGFAILKNKHSVKNKYSEETGVLMDKELNNGRLAMIAFIGMLVQELVTDTTLM